MCPRVPGVPGWWGMSDLAAIEAPSSALQVTGSVLKIPSVLWELDPWGRFHGWNSVDLKTRKWEITSFAIGTAFASR